MLPTSDTIFISVMKRLVCTVSCSSMVLDGLALLSMSKIHIDVPLTPRWALMHSYLTASFSGLYRNMKNSAAPNNSSIAGIGTCIINFLVMAGKDCTLLDQALKKRPGFR